MSIDAALQHAAALHQAGRLDQAEPIYRQVLAASPAHPDALHLLGVLRHQRGDTGMACDLLRRAADAAPRAAAIQNSLGNVLLAAGQPMEAAAAYRRAVRAAPNTAAFHLHLGMALRQAADPQGAETALRQAIRLDRTGVAARVELASLLTAAGKHAEAEATLGPARRAAPSDPLVANALGIARAAAGNHHTAVEAFAEALAARPGWDTALFNQAASLHAVGRTEEALAANTAGLAAHADGTAWTMQSELLFELGRFQEAEQAARQAAAMPGAGPDTKRALGRALTALDRFAEALPLLREAAEIGNTGEAWHHVGLVLRDLGDWDAALPCFARAAELAPEHPTLRTDYGYALMAHGRMQEAGPHFEWRQHRPNAIRLPSPRWDGAPTEKTVLVHAEQGIGDTIQFARFLPDAATRTRIVFAASPSTARLFESLAGISRLATTAPLPPHELHVPLMSLPWLLGTLPEQLGQAVPYLSAPAALISAWRTRLASDVDAKGSARRIGLVWAGNPDYPADRRRSMPAEHLLPLIQTPGCRFVSLQMGKEAGRLPPPSAFDAAPYLADYAETAAAIMALDLVISVDTSVAHLAGALGRPVWLLNRADTDWRWMLNRADSPWYPTMRIFRQPTPGDWADVIGQVRAALAGWTP